MASSLVWPILLPALQNVLCGVPLGDPRALLMYNFDVQGFCALIVMQLVENTLSQHAFPKLQRKVYKKVWTNLQTGFLEIWCT